MFNYDWFHGPAYLEQQDEAKRRCVESHFSEDKTAEAASSKARERFRDEIEIRTLLYLRDGFSYEVKQIADVSVRSHLVFECEPVDEHYKVGAFVVTVPFDELVRVEVYAVHPSQKPEDSPQITGFRAQPEGAEHRPSDGKPVKPSR